MTQSVKKGFVITRTVDHKRNGFLTCDYVEKQDAEARYKEVVASLVFPQELTCRPAWLKEAPGIGRFWIERNLENGDEL